MKKKLLALYCLTAATAYADARPAWLPPEFSTPEEMAAAYQKMKQTQEAAPAPLSEVPSETDRSLPIATTENDFSVSIGTKIWVNRWDSTLTEPQKFTGIGLPDGSTNVTVSSTNGDARLMSKAMEEVTPIPSLTLRYQRLFFTGNYYVPTRFNFTNQATQDIRVGQAMNTSNVSGWGTQTQVENSVNERSEWDVTLGYLIHPNIAITAGYKRIDQAVNTNSQFFWQEGLTGQPYLANEYSVQSDYQMSGPTVGIASSVPIGELFGGVGGLYMNYTHGFFDTTGDETTTALLNTYNDDLSPYSRSTSAKTTDYNVIEAGFTYNLGGSMLPVYLPLSNASIYAGYRYQWLEVQEGDSSSGALNLKDRTDITQGFVTGLNLKF